MWDDAALGCPLLRYLIMNPSSGPGGGRDPGYASVVRAAQARQVKVLGYVDTDRGGRQPDLVAAEVQKYGRWYGVDGIFIDRVATARDWYPYYERLARHIRSTPGSVVALNPGVHPAEIYAQSADVIVTFEGDLETYRSIAVPTWVENYPAERFWHLIHDADAGQVSPALRLAQQRNAGNVYVTDRRMDNPWDRLPSYWLEEVRLISGVPPSTWTPEGIEGEMFQHRTEA